MKPCQPDPNRKTTRSFGRVATAMRAAYEAAHGTPVPSGARVVRTCDTPDCYNPDHLAVRTTPSATPRKRAIRVWTYLSLEEYDDLTNNLLAPTVSEHIRKVLGYDER